MLWSNARICKQARPPRLAATPKGQISECLYIHLLSGIYGGKPPGLQNSPFAGWNLWTIVRESYLVSPSQTVIYVKCPTVHDIWSRGQSLAAQAVETITGEVSPRQVAIYAMYPTAHDVWSLFITYHASEWFIGHESGYVICQLSAWQIPSTPSMSPPS